jgi:hypothetical protein
MFITELLMRDRELRIANMVSSISNVGSGVALTGSQKFSDYSGSDPISTVKSGMAFIRHQTGLVANTLILDYDTAAVLRDHPVLRDYVKYTQGPTLPDGAGELPHRIPWIEARFAGLGRDEVQHGAVAPGVPVCDPERGVVRGSSAHIHKPNILDALDRAQHLAALDHGVRDAPRVEKRAIGKAGQVQVQAPELVGWEASALLSEVGRVSP